MFQQFMRCFKQDAPHEHNAHPRIRPSVEISLLDVGTNNILYKLKDESVQMKNTQYLVFDKHSTCVLGHIHKSDKQNYKLRGQHISQISGFRTPLFIDLVNDALHLKENNCTILYNNVLTQLATKSLINPCENVDVYGCMLIKTPYPKTGQRIAKINEDEPYPSLPEQR